jgi:glutaminyl-peptide cyclotransferase
MGNTGLKIIVFMGMGTLLFLMLMSFGLRQTLKPREDSRVRPGAAKSPFQEARAWADLEYVVGLGPRTPGSPGMRQQQEYVTAELRKAGLKTREFAFHAATPIGELAMKNIAGIVEGTRSGIIVLSGHYDTKRLPDIEFLGANDAGSSTAWLLEMARILGPRREGRSIWLVFFDGEEALMEWTREDSLYGSRHLVSALRTSGELQQLETLINVDMIGDCYLALLKDPGAPDWLTDIVWNTARRQGYSNHFSTVSESVEDDHLPFREAGVPALELIDFSYGGSRIEHKKNWHTAADTLEKVCPESLRAVGDVIYHALPIIEGHLDTMGARSDGH